MAYEALNWTWGQRTDSVAKFVLVALSDFARSPDGEEEPSCWPSVKLLAERTGLSETTVRSKLKHLVEDGLIEKVSRYRANGSQTSNAYRLLMPPPPGAEGAHPPEPMPQEEPLLEPVSEPSATVSPPQPRNIVWDTLAELFGSPVTPGEKADFGKTVRDVKAALEAEMPPLPDNDWDHYAEVEIRRRVESVEEPYRSHRSLRNRWTELGLKAEPADAEEPDALTPDPIDEPCLYCDGSGLIQSEPCKDCGGTGQGTY